MRAAIAAKYRHFGWPELDPEAEIVVTCGSTEAMAASFLALIDPADEVIVLEPFYENYGPDAYLAGATPRVVPLGPGTWRLDPERLREAVGTRTRALILTTPHNPTGRVFDEDEMGAIAELAVDRDLLVFTDEIYEHILYDGRAHRSIALFPGMRERTVTIRIIFHSGVPSATAASRRLSGTSRNMFSVVRTTTGMTIKASAKAPAHPEKCCTR